MGFVKRTPAAPGADDQRQRPRDCAGLAQSLDDPDPAVRRWAARDLAACPDSSALLAARLAGEPERAVRQAMLLTLTELADVAAVQGLAACLRSEDVALRNDAIEAMKNLPRALPTVMADLLADDDADVRIFAVNILEALRHPEVESWLLRVIGRDPHVNVCATAVDLLGEVGSERATEALHGLKLRFPDQPYIHFAADLALRRIQGEGA